MASSKETYCLCGQPYNIGQFMIECDCCREWFHGSCVDVKVYHSDDIDKYHCPKCAPTYGPSVLKIPTNNHRADRYELGAETRPSQAGTPAWVRALAARPPRPHPASLTRLHPSQFTEEFVRDDGFNRPVLFPSSEGLEITTPNPATFSPRSVLRFCGAQFEVEVIDVRKQATLRMPLIDFIDYFETPPEHRDEKVLNVLSLEFSDTNMAPLVEPPAVLSALDWASQIWTAVPQKVAKYCLMSAAGSYTDFHVDFGGTTVWYRVNRGRKIFYLIPPTSTNLALYQQWFASDNQNERFFGDMVEWYGTVELTAGQTLFIPSGWIHAVLTPCDSLVFGGNLLHSYAIEMQLQIYEIERRVDTPSLLRYPQFEAMHWYAGAHFLTLLRRHNEETQDEDFTLGEYNVRTVPQALPALLMRGIKILANALKEWHALKSTDPAKRDNVPKCLNSGQLVRELCKELRTLEKRSTSISAKDKDFKIKSVSPKKPPKAVSAAKKSLKLTLPKPIMHNAMGHNGDFVEADKLYIDNKEAVPAAKKSLQLTLPKPIMHNAMGHNGESVEADKLYIDNKEVVYPDNSYIPAETKYVVDSKELVYNKYQHVAGVDYQEVETKPEHFHDPSTPSLHQPPPPYPLPEHSILKSHLVRERTALRAPHQWSISKRDIGDYQEEQQILYTNGPVHGMYSAEDLQQEYEYVPAKPITYSEYAYAPAEPYTDTYQRYEIHPPRVPQAGGYSNVPALPEQVNGSYHKNLPSYDAAIAQHYHATPTTNNYVIEEQKPPPTPVRRSERPVRRRVSNTYEYEDADLYIDEPPAPRRADRRHKQRHTHHQKREPTNNSAASQYRSTAVHPAPANGIESLIQASVLAEGEPRANETEDAAVEGMLSIGSQYAQPARTFGLPQGGTTAPHESSGAASSSNSKRSRRTAVSSADEEPSSEEEDVIKEVHRDEEYVYPSLEMSSDEDEEWQVTRRRQRHDSRTKSDKDESWSPRARLGRLVPRLRGPARAGVRRECVRAALSHAAAAREQARQPHTRKQPPPLQNAKRAVIESKIRKPPPVPPAPQPLTNKILGLFMTQSDPNAETSSKMERARLEVSGTPTRGRKTANAALATT